MLYVETVTISANNTVSFTDLDQGREILSRFSLPKSMKHSVVILTRAVLTHSQGSHLPRAPDF